MCGNGLIAVASAKQQASARAVTPADVLLAQLELERRVTAEVQDLYSRPIHTVEVVPLVTGEHRTPRVPSTEAA